MEYCVVSEDLEKVRTDCIALCVSTKGRLQQSADIIDKLSGGYLSKVIEQGDLPSAFGSALLLLSVPKVKAKRVILLSLGEEKVLTELLYSRLVSAAMKALAKSGANSVLLCIPEVAKKLRTAAWRVRQTVMSAASALYQFNRFKTQLAGAQASPSLVNQVLIYQASSRDDKQVLRALKEGEAIARGVELCRDLGNLPPNYCTPGYLADKALTLAQSLPFKVDVLDRSDMHSLGMHSLLAVSQGSHEPPKFIVIHYQGAKKDVSPIVFVGKGVTFDTGGISLKPSADMDEMKYDMCGAASVLGTLQAAAELSLPLNIIGIVPAVENMPGGGATRPGDIVTSLSGQTIEILNTDAEGRLILCDALTYAERFSPELVIDIATLTGACVIALGAHAHGLYANSPELADELLLAGKRAADRAWNMPLWEDYQEQLSSPFADMSNVGGRSAGSITAACFLARFTKKYVWAHLDIAGTAWLQGKDKTATGRPVPLLLSFLLRRAGLSEE